MARFFGKVGYGTSVEQTVPDEDGIETGVWVDVITEQNYYGDVIRETRRINQDERVIANIVVDNAISILADEYANKHFQDIKYVEWSGVRWAVTSVEVRSPRLILNLGEVYNGPVPLPPEDEE